MRHRHRSRLLRTAAFVLGSAAALAAQSPGARAEAPRYDRDVRPLLADRCFKCHGPDPASRTAHLRLDERDAALAEREGGVRPIVPGDAANSELWRRITSDDPDVQMPPPDSGKRALSAEERDVLRAWLDGGAGYEPHWSFVAPTPPAVPAVTDTAWCRNEVDRFVLASLERRGVTPGPAADQATQVRRAFLALTGLPPTPAELDAVLADPAPDAYERLVHRLLYEQPYATRYAEHLASPWLDAARYADTCGIHMDAGRQIWPWRDWVLRALRDGMPFDRFVTEQLAGDLLPDATLDQKVASGFHRNHVTTDEGGAIDAEYLVEYAVDRTATTGSVFLGLTLGCARCHEHKYDPISQEEFYRMFAFFDSNEEPGLYSQVPDPKRALEPFLDVPSAEQTRQLEELEAKLADARQQLDAVDPAEVDALQAFVARTAPDCGVAWVDAAVREAHSAVDGGAQLGVQADGSVLATGPNPASDVHVVTLRTRAADLRLVCLEALPDPSLPEGKVGRSPNGNAVLQSVQVEAVSVADPSQRRTVPLGWAWADVEQGNGDFVAVNVLSADDGVGWAVGAHLAEAGPRVCLLLADEAFGFAGGTDVVVTLRYDSMYSQHTFGRVRLSLGSIGDKGLARLPEAASAFHTVGPFEFDGGANGYDTALVPEPLTALDRQQEFGKRRWQHAEGIREGEVGRLPQGRNVSYVAWQLFAPTARHRPVLLGSDDGFVLFADGREVLRREVDRPITVDSDQIALGLRAGRNLLVEKVVNTGGEGSFSLRRGARADGCQELGGELGGDLVAALLPAAARHVALQRRVEQAWRFAFSPGYAAKQAAIAALEQQRQQAVAAIPRSMVMKELAMPRPTFVLQRGAYDQPDKARPVTRGVPAALGALPPGAPANRLGLAMWMCSPDNPLVARVQVNRLWEFLFGTGIVRSSEDFGMQGEWPSHIELLDWLACEFRDGGWDVRAMLERLATSATFRQSSRARPDVRERDPDDRWLAWFPRRRLSAEVIRDQALALSGLLVERLGGPSVKPYQPDGLWKEVAMIQSNTRLFERGAGDDLYRRSLYTYWKRACPPPSLLAFDAPTREFCTIRRGATNTPLQALVLWNDVQYVEAARALAERTLREDVGDGGGDAARLAALYRRCTAHVPDADARQALGDTLAALRTRYRDDADAAAKLLAVGEHMADRSFAASELAAWTLLASAMLQLDATICLD